MASADLRPEQATDDRGQTAATGIMSWLTWLPRLVALHLAWSVMVLLGGVVIGIAPATVTLVTVLRGQNEFARATGSRALAAAVWARYRREVPGANCAAGPFVIIALAAGANVGLGLAGALPAWFFPAGFAAAIIVLVIAILATFHAIALRTLRPAARAQVIWRGALAGPFLLPVATGSLTVTLIATALIAAIIQPVAMLCGGGILVAMTTYLLVRPWQSRLDAALEAAQSSSRGSLPSVAMENGR